MSHATDQEKASVRDLCILKDKYTTHHKAMLASRRPYTQAIKECKEKISSLLPTDKHYTMLNDSLYARRERQATMGKIKPTDVEEALLSVTRSDILSNTPSTSNVWDALCDVVKQKVNDGRRSYSTRFTISKSRPRGGIEIQTTPAIAAAYDEIERAQNSLVSLRGGDAQKKDKEMKRKVDDMERVVLSYMTRTNRKKQKVNIGIADDVKQKFVICRKQRKKKAVVKMEDVIEALRAKLGQLSSLDQFFETKSTIASSLAQDLEGDDVMGDEYLTLLSTGIKSSRSQA